MSPLAQAIALLLRVRGGRLRLGSEAEREAARELVAAEVAWVDARGVLHLGLCPSLAAARILRAISTGEPRTAAEIAAEVGCTDRRVRQVLQRWALEGKALRICGNGRAPRWTRARRKEAA